MTWAAVSASISAHCNLNLSNIEIYSDKYYRKDRPRPHLSKLILHHIVTIPNGAH